MPAAPLPRQVIRERTIAVLLGHTAAGDRVYPSRVLPWRREQRNGDGDGAGLAAIGVYTLAERGVPLGNMSTEQFDVSVDLTIEAVVEQATDPNMTADERLRVDVQAPLDALCAEIEDALWRNPEWYQCLTTERKETRAELGLPQETDRRTAAAIITATVVLGQDFEPVVDDQLDTVAFRGPFGIDVIDPAADPNVTGHPTEPPDGYPGGYPGPDGRPEVEFVLPRPGDAPFWPAPKEEP